MFSIKKQISVEFRGQSLFYFHNYLHDKDKSHNFIFKKCVMRCYVLSCFVFLFAGGRCGGRCGSRCGSVEQPQEQERHQSVEDVVVVVVIVVVERVASIELKRYKR